MSIVKTLEDLQRAIINEEYNVKQKFVPTFLPPGAVIDENKTVKWNYEEVERRNTEMKKKLNEFRDKGKILHNKLKEDMIRAFANESNLTEEKMELIYEFAEKMSSVALSDLIFNIESLIILIQKVNK